MSGQVSYTFPTNTVLAARSYALLAAVSADLQAVYGVANVLGAYSNRLAGQPGTLQLVNREGGIVFAVTYSGDTPWPAAADGAGHSLCLARPSLGEANPAAWAASDLKGGSPGSGESASFNPCRTVQLNEVLASSDVPDSGFIELYNYGAGAVDLSGCILTDDPVLNKFIVPAGTMIPAMGFVTFTGADLAFDLDPAGQTLYLKDPADSRVIDAVRLGAQERGVSMGRAPDGAPGFGRLVAPTPGAANGPARVADVVINEIMYDPLGGDDNDQYLESTIGRRPP